MVGELVSHGDLAVGDATGDRWARDPVTRMERSDLGQEPSGGGGQSQNQNYENLHVVAQTECGYSHRFGPFLYPNRKILSA